jgi:hypothetical protein
MEQKEGCQNIFYFYVHSKLKEHSLAGAISVRKTYSLLARCFRIPKPLRIVIIKELESLGLIEKSDKKLLRILNNGLDFSNTNLIYRKVGLL